MLSADGKTTLPKEEQFSNAWFSIVITESGISIFSKPLHPLNRYAATVVAPSSITAVLRLVHPLNGPIPRLPCADIKLFGIVILVKEVHPSNA